jgi:hypothetical protein
LIEYFRFFLESYTKETYLYFKEQQELERKRLFEELEEDTGSGQGIDIETNNNEVEINEDKYLCLKFQCQDETIEKLKIKKVSLIFKLRYSLLQLN